MSQGPAVFQVTDVPVGAGPELSGADLVSNPSDWGGSLFVDLDNATHVITQPTTTTTQAAAPQRVTPRFAG